MGNGVDRYGGFTVRTECTSCGHPLPLDRPTRQASCSQCQAQVSIPEQVWAHVLEAFDGSRRPAPGAMWTESATVAGFPLQLQVANVAPRCEKCGGALPVAELPAGSPRDFACPSCGDPASTWPAPDWLARLVPSARQLVSTDPGGGATPEGVALDQPVAEAPKPVAMPCPQCGGSLSITAEQERVVSCQYCSTDVFLPDEVWRRLHPVKTVQWFFAGFEGLTPQQRRESAQAAEAQAAIDAAEREKQEKLAAERAQADKARPFLPVVWGLVGLFALWALFVPLFVATSIAEQYFGTAGGRAWLAIVVAALGYTLAIVPAAVVSSLAKGGKPIGAALGYWIGGVVVAGPPLAGAIFALVVLALAFVKGKADEPTSGFGKPIVATYFFLAVVLQFLFFYFAE